MSEALVRGRWRPDQIGRRVRVGAFGRLIATADHRALAGQGGRRDRIADGHPPSSAAPLFCGEVLMRSGWRRVSACMEEGKGRVR